MKRCRQRSPPRERLYDAASVMRDKTEEELICVIGGGTGLSRTDTKPPMTAPRLVQCLI